MTTCTSASTTYHVTCDAWDTVAVVTGASSYLDALERALADRGVPFGESDVRHRWLGCVAPYPWHFKVRGVVYTVEAMR